VTELEREARWAKEGRVSAERREALLQKEVDAMRDLSGTPTPGVFTGNQAARVAQLEKLVESYRSELEAISRDSRDLEERLTQGAGLVKQSALDEAQAKIAQLEKSKCPIPRNGSDLTCYRHGSSRLDHRSADIGQHDAGRRSK
jgi:mitotic spindle assembly checkpoint protein MAD1